VHVQETEAVLLLIRLLLIRLLLMRPRQLRACLRRDIDAPRASDSDYGRALQALERDLDERKRTAGFAQDGTLQSCTANKQLLKASSLIYICMQTVCVQG
jgi:hypothetical protein